MRIEIPENARYIIDTLEENGFEAYVVGGCVRDACLKREAEDWDITTQARPEKIKSLFRRTIDTGIAHGTVTVMLGKDSFEVTTYRVDGDYEDSRHPKSVAYTADLLEDLERRDFTINAMAYNEKKGLVDVFGGLLDLNSRIIRCVGNEKKRFEEDALRILRAVRFSGQLDFAIEEKTKEAMIEQADTLRRISAERIRTELDKLLLSFHPNKLLLLYETGISKVILPEFNHMMETEQRNPHHIYNVGEHSIKAIEIIAEGNYPKKLHSVLAWTMLLHDAAKPFTKSTDEDGCDHFYGHPDKSAEIAVKVLRRFKFDNDTIDKVSRLIKWHDYRFNLEPAAIRRAMNKIGEDILESLLLVQRADTLAQSEYQREEKLDTLRKVQKMMEEIKEAKQCIKLPDLAINGKILLDEGFPQGVMIGVMLRRLLDLVLENPDLNKKEELLLLARTWLQEK